MKAIVIICVAFLELATLQAAEGYEVFYPYGYVDPMMRSDYASSQALPASSRLLLAPLANLMSKGCPSNVNGGQVIGHTCFTVTTTPTAFFPAEAECNINGGTLAQPLPLPGASQNFYTELKAKFPTQFTTVEAAGANPGLFWIGYLEALAGGPFIAQDWAGNSVAAGNAIFVPPVLIADPLSAAAIFNPGTTWRHMIPATLLPFICQYTLVI